MGKQSVLDSQAMYREREKLCLKWNDFQENAIYAFGTLREDREFADVTLACEDGQQVEAHKVVLASSSPFFLNLLRRNKHPHPLIYMRGLKLEDLVAIVDFLYLGEANVYQENLDSFLALSEELQLKGLMESGAEKMIEGKYGKFIPQQKSPKSVQKRNNPKKEASIPDLETNYICKVEPSPEEGEVAFNDYTRVAYLQDLDDKIKSMIENTGKSISASGKNRIAMKCKVCGKEAIMDSMMKHIESHHITGVSHNCNICGMVAKTRHSLKSHNIGHNEFVDLLCKTNMLI